ncbi:ribonuclease H-like domain-containing protein [Fennellomyces sp. T-0311]|nr:ribonuclease H-like domain-containing protein [Fennellomyces sp. T-0311]
MRRFIHLINKVQSVSIPSFSRKIHPCVLEDTAFQLANFHRRLLHCRYVTTSIASTTQQSTSRLSRNDTDLPETLAGEEGLDDNSKGKQSLQVPPDADETSLSEEIQPVVSERKALEENLSTLKFPSHYKVVCTADPNQMNAHIISLLSKNEHVFGLDMEWQPQFKKGQPQNRVALIQICGHDTILLFQVAKLKCLPSELVRFLNNPRLFKSGVNILGDGNKLHKDFNVITNGLVELDIMTKHIQSPLLGQTKLRSLNALTCLFLKHKLSKSKKVRLSNWAQRSLTPKQIEYAASDAYASYKLCTIFRDMLLEQKKTHITTFIIHLSKGLPKAEPQQEDKEMAEPRKATQTTTVIIQKRAVKG